jgi:hypothetical protein
MTASTAMPIPPILLSPPWVHAKTSKSKSKSDGPRLEAPPIEERIVWGDRGRARIPWGSPKEQSAELDAEVLGEIKKRGSISYVRLFDATNDVMFSILEKNQTKISGSSLEAIPYLLSRLGERVIPHVHSIFDAQPFEALDYVLALRSAAIAPFAAEAWHKRKKLKMEGGRWLIRHPEAASLVLLPIAAGKAGKARDAALAALALLEKEEPTAFASALAHYGDAGVAAWNQGRGEPAATGEPDKAPPAPSFLSEVHAPLVDGQPLPSDTLKNFCGILALAPHPDPHPAMMSIVAACDADSLATFARTLFEAWQRAGLSREHGYIARAAVHLGDDTLLTELADLAEEWASGGGYARAVWIVEALALRKTNMTALAELDHIDRRARSWGLRHAACWRLRQIAEERGVSREDLGDALVSDLGIGKAWGDAGHTLALDGDQLVLVDKSGARSQKPSGEAGQKAFGVLRKDLRTIYSRQKARLETAMLDGRQWSAASFATLVAHPLLGQLARRLVWMVTTNDSSRAIRVAEDRSFADVDDNELRLDEEPSTGGTPVVHVAHPVDLGADLPRWVTRMHEYKLIEPFPQLSREVFTPSAAESADPLAIAAVPPERLAGVARGRGWSAGEIEDGGRIHYLSRTVRGSTCTMSLDPGLLVGSWSSSEPQSVSCSFSKSVRSQPVLYSEVRRDLAALQSPN